MGRLRRTVISTSFLKKCLTTTSRESHGGVLEFRKCFRLGFVRMDFPGVRPELQWRAVIDGMEDLAEAVVGGEAALPGDFLHRVIGA